MSIPTRQFRRLSITSDMPTSRIGREKQYPAVDSDNSEVSDDGGDSEVSEGQSLAEYLIVHGKSGIAYDLASLDLSSKARALVGLTSHFDVWLHDQLHGCLFPEPPTSSIPLSSNRHLPNLGRIKDLIDGDPHAIAARFDWQYSHFGALGGMERQKMVRDIMSAFDSAILPEDFRPDLVNDDPRQSRTPEQCVVQGDLEATLFRLAVHVDAVYASLCKAMPIGACTAIYYDKVQQKLRILLADFDRYCQTGQLPKGVDFLDASTVLEEIRDHVNRIRESVVTRAPHGIDGAAKALLTLLEDICNRNKDALEGNEWGQKSFHGEDEDQRNLYHQLIGRANETGDFFILDVLDLLPVQGLRQFEDKIEALLRRIEVNRAPKAYIMRLSSLLRAVVSEGVGAGHKRPCSATATGNSKRTR
ncbi:uncharacterized protein BP01DRAFT_393481 [Aspergillus saccharolyticus JOP 1030-1]|uniref:Uncharacterized protein n=1 Tax=Aspergillus saccharolyticus JOP 1030-1 TaxID=1450539 RepID=A0A318ZAN6_9EURO|nr:hypothetical protein BP01DRAFT_393481 [Aspergillus saccharolyticus JOP 1030-1]PYH43384.1 hypothetical protein BP01DRAFT_393481 [Aspergillus saccharolyticus JOP 1030-1]